MFNGGNFRYDRGEKYCSVCVEFKKPGEFTMRGEAPYCNECHYKMRSSPRRNTPPAIKTGGHFLGNAVEPIKPTNH